MQGTIQIYLGVSDADVASDIIKALEMILPYMADNVIVTSEWE